MTWERILSKEDAIVTGLFSVIADEMIKKVSETGDTDTIIDSINIAERLHATLIISLVCQVLTEHKGHRDCDTVTKLPEFIDRCKKDFVESLDANLKLNLSVNGLSMEKTHNEKQAEEIIREMENDDSSNGE